MWRGVGWPVTLEHDGVILRPLRRSDQRAWDEVRVRNREWLAPWEATNPVPAEGLMSFAEMVRSLKYQARTGSALPFAIAVMDRDGQARFAGQLTVSSIVWGSARMATAGYWVDGARAGRGIVPTALALAADYCFQNLGLHRMEVNIRPENAPSLRVVEKLGFRDEGLRPRYLHINGAWADHRSFALTAEEVPEGLLARLDRHRG
ncbi:GNAT family N-acetyltransferase [Psychromicrobium xiongbiense]|uniref:GNAT family N-acetyltransferase n=1 Tax=Psychromicrobium xiongbiense TaxID=3051184 RepID=UPI002553929B|nr:GNAT family protein [Psychromicrobium sp. YIM S02556]